MKQKNGQAIFFFCNIYHLLPTWANTAHDPEFTRQGNASKLTTGMDFLALY